MEYTSIITGMTGSQFRNAINSNNALLFVDGIRNVLNYDVIGDGLTDNTSALQTLINDTTAKGGTIYFPAGTYLTDPLVSYGNVKFLGDGANKSIIKAKSLGGTTITISYDPNGAFNGHMGAIFESICLDGDNKANNGIELGHLAFTDMREVVVRKYKNYGIYLKGSLIGKIERACLHYNAVGIYAEKDSGSNYASVNLFQIKNSRFDYCTKYAAQWHDGSLVKFEDCDFEYNGTLGDNTTGCIYYDDEEGFYGLILDGCWFEMNNGVCVYLPDNTVAQHTHTFSNCYFTNNIANAAHYDIKVFGGTRINRILLQSCILREANSIYISGTYASVMSIHSSLSYAPVTDSNGIYSVPINTTGIIAPIVQSSPPASPTEGMIYANTDHHLYYYNGTGWKQLDN